jgi:ParB family transcriptional regulator, chromosome partitioning protein
MSAKKSALGKGLGALLDISGVDNNAHKTQSEVVMDSAGNESLSVELPIKNIEANPFQPRTHFEKEALEELVESIKIHGIIQPLTLRKLGQNRFQIISGERRYRAAQLAGLTSVPVYVREADDKTMLEMAIIENIQRKDLNAIEIAMSYQRLIDECAITQEEVGERMSKSRASVTNYLRLLNLPPEIQAGIRDEKITMGHARALLSFENASEMIKVFRMIIDQNLSVRKVEEMGKEAKTSTSDSKKKGAPMTLPKSVLRLKDNLSFHLGTKINISKDEKGKGKITIPFEDEEHLIRIIESLDK